MSRITVFKSGKIDFSMSFEKSRSRDIASTIKSR
jgi:hypothetical protein